LEVRENNMSMEQDPEYDNAKQSHKDFITAVMAGKSHTDAYALAFPNASRKTAGSKATVLYRKYKNLIQRHSPLTADMVQVIADQTIQNLKQMAFADASDMIDKTSGRPLPLHKMPKAVRMGITEMSVSGNKYKYVMGGKMKALELLAKITKLDEAPKTEVNISITQEEKENRIREILVQAISREGKDND